MGTLGTFWVVTSIWNLKNHLFFKKAKNIIISNYSNILSLAPLLGVFIPVCVMHQRIVPWCNLLDLLLNFPNRCHINDKFLNTINS